MEKKFNKGLIIGAMCIFFWLLSLIVKEVVNSRGELAQEAMTEVKESWGGSQTVTGPVICVPLIKTGDTVPFSCLYILPDSLEVNAELNSEKLHRGLFDVNAYRSGVSGKGTFDLKNWKTSIHAEQYLCFCDWSRAQLIVSVSDSKGLGKDIQVSIGGIKTTLNGRFNNYNGNLRSAYRFEDKTFCKTLDLNCLLGYEVNFSFQVDLKGTEEFNIAPIGNKSHITISGNCSHPSFNGIVLPSEREVSHNSFAASWDVSSVNRDDVHQSFFSRGNSVEFNTVGTRLLVLGGQYTQTDRAMKYAFLVIFLIMIAVFVAEMSVKSEINYLNYILIGFAVVLFYLLLLSLGEWIGFTPAYIVAAVLIIGMITLYLKAIVHNSKVAWAVCLFMTLVDVFIYILLSAENIALLLGSLGLFVVLGVVMYLSLNLNTKKKSIEPSHDEPEIKE
ncbi:MAG: inner membrane CreD family protein [Bacteroidales bacterium]|nr:inner membrane CreD family protein [Candidatus Colimorpha onthohippi]